MSTHSTVTGILAAALTGACLALGNADACAQTLHTRRGYPYDSRTCSSGFQPCMNQHARAGWHNAAAASYCSDACRDFPSPSVAVHAPQ
jgi:hypothetical protein